MLGECTNLIIAMNKYAYQNAEGKQTEAILLNRPGSERRINLTPYFRDVKEDISLSGTPECGELEYVLTDNKSNTQT